MGSFYSKRITDKRNMSSSTASTFVYVPPYAFSFCLLLFSPVSQDIFHYFIAYWIRYYISSSCSSPARFLSIDFTHNDGIHRKSKKERMSEVTMKLASLLAEPGRVTTLSQ